MKRDCTPTAVICKSRGLYKAFNKSEIPIIPLHVKSSKSPQVKKSCIRKIILLLPEYYKNVHETKD